MAAACGRGDEDAAGTTADLATGTTLAPATMIPATPGGPAYSELSGAVVVAGKDQYLAAWTELHLATKKTSVVAARVGRDGALLGDQNLSLGAVDDRDVALAFDGDRYLAVWTHKSGGGSVISGARIGADGKLLDAQPFTLGRANGNAKTPAVAYTTGGYLVAWSDDRDSGASADAYRNEVYGARISTAGMVVGSNEGFRITNQPGTLDGSLSVAAAGPTFLVGYTKHDDRGTSAQALRVSDAGAVLDAQPLTFGEKGQAPSIAANGDEFFVAWNDAERVAGARVSKDGVKLGDLSLGTNQPASPTVAWDGEAFSVAWKSGLRRVGADGALMGDPLAGAAAVAGAGDSLFVVRQIDADAARDLPARLSGELLPKAGGAATKAGIVLARGGAPFQRDVVTAAHGASSLSVWLEYEDPARPELRGAIYTNGAATPLTIDDGAGSANAAPAVAFDGTTYVVAWQTSGGDDPRTNVVHVNDLARVIDAPSSFAGGAPQLTPGSPNKVLLTTRTAQGKNAATFLDRPEVQIPLASEPAGWTPSRLDRAAWDGSRYVLAWSTTKQDGNAEIHAQRFDKSGAPMDAPPIKVATVPLPSGAELPKVAVATNGADTLLAFASPSTHQILGARLGPNGLVDTTPVRLDVGSDGYAFEPRLAWDGTQWTLAYERRADAAVADPSGYAIELTRVRPSADRLDVVGPAQAIATRGLRPAIAAGAKGATFLSYEAIGTDDLAGPRVAFTLFTDTTGASPSPGPSSSSSSGGATAPGDDDDGEPVAPAGDGDAPTKKPSVPQAPPTKSATIKPISGGGGDRGEDGGGCSTSGTSGAPSSPLLFLAVGALLLRRRRA